MSKLMNRDEWEILNFVEERHMKKGIFPSVSTITRNTKINQVRVVECLSNPLVQKSLDARGIQWQPIDDDRLTPQQIATLQLVLNVTDQRSIKQKLESLGVNVSTYQGWKKQPHFMEAYRELSEKLYGESLPEVHQALIKRAVDGDHQAQKLMLAIAGRWDDKKSVESLNVKFVIMKVLEVIQRHVHDKDTLESIAREFEVILSPDQREITQ